MSASTTAAAAAAAEKRRREQEEEEEMTSYTSDELNQDWEFKIVRSTMEAFGNPQKLRQLMDEEAHAGWVFVEKFDNARVRFKRPTSARARDALLPSGVDPYRTSFGMSAGAVGLAVLAVVGIIGLVVILAIVLVSYA